MVTKRTAWTSRRSDIIDLDFDLGAGHEQQGTQPALVLLPEAFNRFGLDLAGHVTPGSAFACGHAWTMALAGAWLATGAVVLCNQVRTVDLKARRAQIIEAMPPELVADVLARVATLIE